LEQITPDFVRQAGEWINMANSILILSHKNPDGDALGSGLALMNYFTNTEKNAAFIVPDQMPQYLSWMPGFEKVIVQKSQPSRAIEWIEKSDLIILVDFNNPNRLADLALLVAKKDVNKILIDHHPNPENMAGLVYSRISASSTSEMIYELIAALQNHALVAKDVACCLFTGLMTDTGCFSYNSSQGLTYRVVGHLLESGIDKDEIVDQVYNNFSESRLRLLGHSLSQKMVVLPEFRTAYIWLTKTELEEYKHQQGDTEGLVNYPLSIKGIVFSAIFIEKDNLTKCSFRSKGDFPSNLLAKEHFNGGGHLNAAGGERYLPLNETLQLFEKILPYYKKYLPD
jgi:bifunctional oligoribonuclease and PAP phosphatase NrnA